MSDIGKLISDIFMRVFSISFETKILNIDFSDFVGGVISLY